MTRPPTTLLPYRRTDRCPTAERDRIVTVRILWAPPCVWMNPSSGPDSAASWMGSYGDQVWGVSGYRQQPRPALAIGRCGRARDGGVGPLLEHASPPLRLRRRPAGRVRDGLPSAPTCDHRGRLKPNQPSLPESQGGSAGQASLCSFPLHRGVVGLHNRRIDTLGTLWDDERPRR